VLLVEHIAALPHTEEKILSRPCLPDSDADGLQQPVALLPKQRDIAEPEREWRRFEFDTLGCAHELMAIAGCRSGDVFVVTVTWHAVLLHGVLDVDVLADAVI
jgi:hypothetical protein